MTSASCEGCGLETLLPLAKVAVCRHCLGESVALGFCVGLGSCGDSVALGFYGDSLSLGSVVTVHVALGFDGDNLAFFIFYFYDDCVANWVSMVTVSSWVSIVSLALVSMAIV